MMRSYPPRPWRDTLLYGLIGLCCMIELFPLVIFGHKVVHSLCGLLYIFLYSQLTRCPLSKSDTPNRHKIFRFLLVSSTLPSLFALYTVLWHQQYYTIPFLLLKPLFLWQMYRLMKRGDSVV